MLASHKWLTELGGFELEPDEVAERLTSIGLEVETVTRFGEHMPHVVIAEVRGLRPHPERDKLRLVTVFDGAAESEVVCGASNVPEPGGRVVLAQLGAKLPGDFEITERKLGGVVSRGMLCSETELGIGFDEAGIIVVEADNPAAPGTPVTEALDLDDVVYEIGLTPNRPDCLGHNGIARDLCVALGRPFGRPKAARPEALLSAPEDLFPQADSVFSLSEALSLETGEVADAPRVLAPVRVDIEDPERCPRYAATLLTGVTVKPSPFRLRYRLFVLGQRAISNVVDATNLILLGFGHPIHAFDYDRLAESRIVVRLAKQGESMVTLDGEQRALTADDLLICDGQGPVALAGVMGGQNSEIHAGTTNVLIECAYFAARSIRRTSKRTGLHTDASHRFERGLDPTRLRDVAVHAASLVASVSGGRVFERGLDVHPRPYEPPTLRLRLARVEALLGWAVAAGDAERILGGLGCRLQPTGGGFKVVPPGHRPDLQREIDLIEELARIVGYDAIPAEVPTAHPSKEGTPAHVRFVRAAREAAAAAGLNEAVNYAFVSPGDLRAARLPEAALSLTNPMSEDRSVMRTGLLSGLAANLKLAQRHQERRFVQFELGRVFRPHDSEKLPDEHYELGFLVWGQRALSYEEGAQLGFFDMKGFVAAALQQLLGAEPETVIGDVSGFLHPKRSAVVRLNDVVLGELGELHPDVVDALELVGRPVFARLSVPAMQGVLEATGLPQGRPVPRFPAAVRDVSVVVPETLQAGEAARVLKSAAGPRAESVTIFDIYRGKPVPDGHKSLAFHVVYRDAETTLTDKVVDKAHAAVLRAAEREFAGSVRK